MPASSSPTRPTRPRPSSSGRSRGRSPTGPGSGRVWPARRVGAGASRHRRRSRSRPGGASWRRWPRAARPCSSFEDLHWADDGAARLPRAPGRLVAGRAAAGALHRPARAVRAASDLGGRAPQRDHDQPRPADRRGDRAADRGAARARGAAGRDAAGACSSGRAATRCTPRSSCACSPTASELGEAVEQVPDSVQALIAARLDTLSPERKSLLQDAAVVGKVFWAGALAEMGGRDAARGRAALHELARKELVRPARTSLDAGRGRVRLLAPAGQGRLLRADPARRRVPPGTAPRPPGSSGRPASGPRTWPTCSPTTT